MECRQVSWLSRILICLPVHFRFQRILGSDVIESELYPLWIIEGRDHSCGAASEFLHPVSIVSHRYGMLVTEFPFHTVSISSRRCTFTHYEKEHSKKMLCNIQNRSTDVKNFLHKMKKYCSTNQNSGKPRAISFIEQPSVYDS